MAKKDEFDIVEGEYLPANEFETITKSKDGGGKNGGKEGGDDEGGDDEGGEDGQGGKEGGDETGEGGSGGGGGSDQTRAMSDEAAKREAEDMLRSIKETEKGKTHSCGSFEKRRDQQGNISPVEKDAIIDRKNDLMDALQRAAKEGKLKGNNPYNELLREPSQAGTGPGGGGEGELILAYIPKRSPKWIKEITNFEPKGTVKKKIKKGSDWFEIGYFSEMTKSKEGSAYVQFKEKPKGIKKDKYLYILVDVSGSMTGYVNTKGESLLEQLIGLMPLLAKEFSGEIWYTSVGIIKLPAGTTGYYDSKSGKDFAIYDLKKTFKGKDELEIAKHYKEISKSTDFGGGTTFDKEFRLIEQLRQGDVEFKDGRFVAAKNQPKTDAALLVLTDSDFSLTTIPKNVLVVTDRRGVDTVKRNYKNELNDKGLNFNVVNFNEDSSYKQKEKNKTTT